MKIIAFFNEKGGVGKSTFTLMYASQLKYKYGVKVGVADFNNRLTGYRKDEIRTMRQAEDIDESIIANAWPIVPVDRKAVAGYGPNNPGYALWLEKLIREGEFKDMDVVIADLPGSVSGRELIHLVMYKMVNLVFVPFDKEQQAIEAAMAVKNFLRKVDGCRFCGFFNMVQTSFGSKSDYVDIMEVLERQKLPVLPDMVSFSERMKNFGKVDPMRSTFSYPDWNRPEYKGSRDLGIENLFIDITKEVNKAPDFRGTSKTYLSFVDNLQKDTSMQSLNRQLCGTSFPEYEVPMDEEAKTKFRKNR